MKASHIHIGVRDFEAACSWLETTWQLLPNYRNTAMAVYPFYDGSLVFDKSEVDTEATIAFSTDNCDKEFEKVLGMGAIPIEPPTDQSWGVRVAYIRGPGRLTFEIEQKI